MMKERVAQNRLLTLLAIIILLVPSRLFGQATSSADPSPNGFWTKWFERSDKTKQEQPHWITPLATTTPRLEQEFRYDILWQQPKPGANYTVNIGNSKGLELIPAEKVELILAVPPYIIHRTPNVKDGLGDFRILTKYRLISANESSGNYIVTAFFDVILPTAQDGNGTPNAVFTPTIAYGKGIKQFDVQGTFGLALPAGNEAAIGRTYSWNNTLQYQLLTRVWPEMEVNANFFEDGPNGGKKQILITPGLVIGRLSLTSRLGLTFGAGVQIPASQFHTIQSNVIFSVRLPF